MRTILSQTVLRRSAESPRIGRTDTGGSMTDLLPPVTLGHVAATPVAGDAARRVLSREDFDRAEAEITAWEGYAPTPLVALAALAAEIGVAEVLYKDEGPRFGLGSFKALGGAYAALRVLQREISARSGSGGFAGRYPAWPAPRSDRGDHTGLGHGRQSRAFAGPGLSAIRRALPDLHPCRGERGPGAGDARTGRPGDPDRGRL